MHLLRIKIILWIKFKKIFQKKKLLNIKILYFSTNLKDIEIILYLLIIIKIIYLYLEYTFNHKLLLNSYQCYLLFP